MGFNLFKKAEEVPEKTSVADKYQISRKTAANARPAREQAGSVRIAGKQKQASPLMSKEEKEEIKRRDRQESDLRDGVAEAMLRDNEAYKKMRRAWYFMLLFGLVLIAVSYISLQYQVPDEMTWANYTSIATLIGAYACIFTAFFYDLGKIRPLRKEVFARVSRMNLKQVENHAIEYQKRAESKDKKTDK